MRKKTVTHSVKTIFWWIVYCLPLIIYMFVLWGNARNGNAFVSFDEFVPMYFESPNFIIIDPLMELFGIDGVLPFFISDGLFTFMEWFVGVYLVHLAIDFILFIPRLCHKFMNKFTRSEDCE